MMRKGQKTKKTLEKEANKDKVKPDLEELERLARLHVTYKEMAEWFGCNESLLQYEPYFTIIAKARSETKQRLKQKALQRALVENSDTLLIFCLKNYCGWGDNKSIIGEGEVPSQRGYTIQIIPPVNQNNNEPQSQEDS
jgi:hypothetical protein